MPEQVFYELKGIVVGTFIIREVSPFAMFVTKADIEASGYIGEIWQGGTWENGTYKPPAGQKVEGQGNRRRTPRAGH